MNEFHRQELTSLSNGQGARGGGAILQNSSALKVKKFKKLKSLTGAWSMLMTIGCGIEYFLILRTILYKNA